MNPISFFEFITQHVESAISNQPGIEGESEIDHSGLQVFYTTYHDLVYSNKGLDKLLDGSIVEEIYSIRKTNIPGVDALLSFMALLLDSIYWVSNKSWGDLYKGAEEIKNTYNKILASDSDFIEISSQVDLIQNVFHNLSLSNRPKFQILYFIGNGDSIDFYKKLLPSLSKKMHQDITLCTFSDIKKKVTDHLHYLHLSGHGAGRYIDFGQDGIKIDDNVNVIISRITTAKSIDVISALYCHADNKIKTELKDAYNISVLNYSDDLLNLTSGLFYSLGYLVSYVAKNAEEADTIGNIYSQIFRPPGASFEIKNSFQLLFTNFSDANRVPNAPEW